MRQGVVFAVAGLCCLAAATALRFDDALMMMQPGTEMPMALAQLFHDSPVIVAVDQKKCLNMCSGRGRCVVNTDPNAPPQNTTICVCNQGWTGSDCGTIMLPADRRRDESLDCPRNCSSHGVCYRGSSVVLPRCYCDPQYTGADCSVLREQFVMCHNNCSGFGVCVEGLSTKFGAVIAKCLCDANHAGDDCSIEIASPCPRGCSGHGACTAQGCVCNPTFSGIDCSVKVLPDCSALSNCSSRGRCLNGQCHCFPGYGGDDCSQVYHLECPHECNGHGHCVISTPYFPGGCKCDAGWLPPDCEIAQPDRTPQCEKNCSNNGICRETDKCECFLGWTGKLCDFPASVTPSKLIGPTYSGEPIIHPYYMSGKIPERDTNDRATFVESHEHPTCPNNCSSHGVCLEILSSNTPSFNDDGSHVPESNAEPKLAAATRQFVCRCDKGYIGEDCSFAPPPNSGIFPMGQSEILAAPRPPAPKVNQPPATYMEDPTSWDSLPTLESVHLKEMGCPHNCSSRGRCIRNKEGFPLCSCYPGWSGKDCSEKGRASQDCPLKCSEHGRCVVASEYFPVQCLCDEGYYGELCERRREEPLVYHVEEGFCPNHCSGRGICADGKCVCMEVGYGGPDCSVQAGGKCERNCNGNGVCFWGTCECLGGYTGELCDSEPAAPCPNHCHKRGKCVGGTCICMTGFSGNDCSDVLVTCPNHCSGHGECNAAKPQDLVPASCVCDDGWTGHDCSNFPHNVEIPEPEHKPTKAERVFQQRKQSQLEQSKKKSAFEQPAPSVNP